MMTYSTAIKLLIALRWFAGAFAFGLLVLVFAGCSAYYHQAADGSVTRATVLGTGNRVVTVGPHGATATHTQIPETIGVIAESAVKGAAKGATGLP